MITGCITDGITGLHRISGGVGQEGGIWSICKTRQLEYYSDKKTQLKGVSLSGLRYAVFAGDEKTLILSREARRGEKWPFGAGTPRPTDPLLPQRAGRELFLILLSRFLPFFSDFDPDRSTRRAQRCAIFWGRKLRPTDPPRPRPGMQSPLSTSYPLK